jgi:integrase
VASAWVVARRTKGGAKRYRVLWRVGGHATPTRYGGSFATRSEALARRRWISGELASMRVPDLRRLTAELPEVVTVKVASGRWLGSRIDVAEATRVRNELEVARIDRLLGGRPVEALTPAEVAIFVTTLVAEEYARGTIRKTLQSLAMILDHERVHPNPARDRVEVRLPREESVELNPPTAEHVEAVYRLLPRKHRLALLWLDWSGQRVSSIDKLLVRDYDEPRRRVRVPREITKMRKGLWVDLPPVLAQAIEERLGPREDRDLGARLFPDSRSTALRTAITRACRAAGVPEFSPHHLRHRRVSVLHLRGMPWARIGEHVGQSDLSTTANTYTHVLIDETEVDYEELLAA